MKTGTGKSPSGLLVGQGFEPNYRGSPLLDHLTLGLPGGAPVQGRFPLATEGGRILHLRCAWPVSWFHGGIVGWVAGCRRRNE